jgi:hypothetical protein
LKKQKSRRPKKNPEYEIGIVAQKRFEQALKTLFRAPKAVSKNRPKDKD